MYGKKFRCGLAITAIILLAAAGIFILTRKQKKAPANIVLGIICDKEMDNGEFLNGIAVAIGKINASGGFKGKKIECRICTDVASIRDANITVGNLADSGCLAVIVYADWDVSKHVLPMSKSRNIIVILPNLPRSEIKDIPEYKYCFAIFSSPDSYIDPTIRYMKQNGLRNIAVIYPKDLLLSKKLADYFGGKAYLNNIAVATRQTYAYNLPAPVIRHKFISLKTALEFDSILILDQSVKISGILTAIGPELNVPVITCNDLGTYVNNPAIRNLNVPLVYCTYSARKKQEKQHRDFALAYLDRYGSEPGRLSFRGADSVTILFNAICKADSREPGAIAAAIKQLNHKPLDSQWIDTSDKKNNDFITTVISPTNKSSLPVLVNTNGGVLKK